MSPNCRCSLAVLVLLTAILDARAAPPAERKPRLDAHGDLLPDDALARLGSRRFREAGRITATALSPDGNVLFVSGFRRPTRLLTAATGKELRRFKPDQFGVF